MTYIKIPALMGYKPKPKPELPRFIFLHYRRLSLDNRVVPVYHDRKYNRNVTLGASFGPGVVKNDGK